MQKHSFQKSDSEIRCLSVNNTALAVVYNLYFFYKDTGESAGCELVLLPFLSKK